MGGDLPTRYRPGCRRGVRPLLEHRRGQAGAIKPERFREFAGHLGYRSGEAAADFVARHGVAIDMPAAPDYGVPYYLLLVAPPTVVPYRFQYELDVQYAVGRVWFELPDGTPDVEAFDRYARRVVAAETGGVSAAPRAVFFGVRNDGLREATQLSADYLIDPLFGQTKADHPNWAIESVPHPDTVKDRLRTYVGGLDTPALLFTASHGIAFNRGDPRQAEDQGALLCQDWPGADAWAEADPAGILLRRPGRAGRRRPPRAGGRPLRLLQRRHPATGRLPVRSGIEEGAGGRPRQ